MDKIEERIKQLKQQRDQLVTQANLQIANLNGQIQALEELIAPKEQANDDATPAES